MKTFRKWLKDARGEDMPDVMDGDWFASRGLPMIVACANCETTMALPNALIDEEGTTFCHDCGAGDDVEDIEEEEVTPLFEDEDELEDCDFNLDDEDEDDGFSRDDSDDDNDEDE